MSHRPVVALGALLTCSALFVTGCGSSGPTLTRAQIDAQANAICKKANAASANVPQPADIYDAADEEGYFNLILPVALAATIELKKLKPNGDVSSDWHAFMTQREAGEALLQTVTDRVNAHDPSAVPLLQKQGPGLTAKIDAAAHKVGAAQCAP
jgi:hypothetical protein